MGLRVTPCMSAVRPAGVPSDAVQPETARHCDTCGRAEDRRGQMTGSNNDHVMKAERMAWTGHDGAAYLPGST